jgi:hypothetical protein
VGPGPSAPENRTGGAGACAVYPADVRPGTAYRLPCEREATGREPVVWQRWRRQHLEQTRELIIVCAQGDYGIVHFAEYSLLVGVKLEDRPLGIGTRQDVLAKYRLMTRH